MKNFIIWFLAFIFTAGFAIYQRLTGPTYPVKANYSINGHDYTASLIRTYGGDGDAKIVIPAPDNSISGTIKWRRFKSNDEWQELYLVREGDNLICNIPHQPPAGKVMYLLSLNINQQEIKLNSEPVIIRFKGDVPLYFLIPHIVFIFLAMFFSVRTGIEAFLKRKSAFLLTKLTILFLLFGGLVFGPIIQYYAFGAFWTGWPWGHDLTDNKTAVAIILWIIAYFKLRKNPDNRTTVIIASIGLIAVYLIPHSVLGSEIDFTQPINNP